MNVFRTITSYRIKDCRITDCKVAFRNGSIVSVPPNHFGIKKKKFDTMV